jgi:hypothetical protein
MRAFSNADFLDMWELGVELHPVDQGLLALSAAFPEVPPDELAKWTLGRRNRAIAQLRTSLFGHALEGWAACGRCGEKLEFTIDGGELARDGQNRGEAEGVELNGQHFRLPNSRDLAAAAREPDSRAAAIRLLECCRQPGGDLRHQWSDEEVEAVGELMARSDPMAETLIQLRCPVCGFECEESLDLVSFLWTEIAARAKRLLLEVHALASAYGWAEQEILALSEHRRAFYLGIVRA